MTSHHLAVFNTPDDVFLAEVGAVQERDVDEDVVVRLHDVLGLRAEDGAPLEAHDGLQGEVAVCILEWKGQACSSPVQDKPFPLILMLQILFNALDCPMGDPRDNLTDAFQG